MFLFTNRNTPYQRIEVLEDFSNVGVLLN